MSIRNGKAREGSFDVSQSCLDLYWKISVYIYPRPMHLKKQGGVFAGSPFEQISMQRLTGVPSPISGGAGTVGSG